MKMTYQEKLDYIENINSDADVYLMDEYANALVGYTESNGVVKAVYNYDRCITCLVKQGMSRNEAVEYFEYNTIGALPSCENAPVIVRMFK